MCASSVTTNLTAWQLSYTKMHFNVAVSAQFTKRYVCRPSQLSSRCFYSLTFALTFWLALTPWWPSAGQVRTWGIGPAVERTPWWATNIVAVSAGRGNAFALTSDGLVIAWGWGGVWGETNVPPEVRDIVAIAAGPGFTLALRVDGRVFAWGAMDHRPATVPEGLEGVAAIAAGDHHCLALRADGTVAAWGDNKMGQCQVPSGLGRVVGIAGGEEHSLALKADGTVVAWGANQVGQARVPSGLTNVVAIAAFWAQSIALKADGTVVTWGANAFLPPADLANVVAISARWPVGVALRADGSIVEWGQGVLPKPADLRWPACVAVGEQSRVAVVGDGKPYATIAPLPQSVEVGGRVTFHVRASGEQGMTYQWQLAERDIPGATSLFYSIPSVGPADAGQYTVVISNQHGKTITRPALLEVRYATTSEAPVLPAQQDRMADEGVELIVANTASAAYTPNLVLKYRLVNPPPGASIDAQGVIRWTPSDDQSPGSYVLTTIVWDNGFPSLSATNSFTVFVNELNYAPVLPGQSDRTISTRSHLVVNNGATDADRPADLLQYSLLEAPSGAEIDASGVIRWKPGEQHAWTTHTFTTEVADNGLPPKTAVNSFRVSVQPLETLLVLPHQADAVLDWAQYLKITNTARSFLIPSSAINYALLNPPNGARISPGGIITWVPSRPYAETTNLITTVATELGQPPLSITNTFSVVVRPMIDTPPVDILAGPFTYPANNHLYYILEPSGWFDAEEAAIRLGGHLVTINDQAEHFWLKDVFSRYGGQPRELWIGMLDPDPFLSATDTTAWMKQLSWASGEPVTFQFVSLPQASTTGWGMMKLQAYNPDRPYDEGSFAPDGPYSIHHSIIEVAPALQITAQPHQVSAALGTDITLSVVAESGLPMQYQWQFEGVDLAGATTATLTIPNAQPSHTGAYRVVVRNRYDMVVSQDAEVVVQGIVGWGLSSGSNSVFNLPPETLNISAIEAGRFHGLALREDGTVVAWGENSVGQTTVPRDLGGVIAVSAANNCSLALKADGTIVAWGDNTYGQLDVPVKLRNVMAISAGMRHCLALRSTGEVIAWGETTDTPDDLGQVVAIAAGFDYSMALRSDGTVRVWGAEVPPVTDIPPGVSNVAALAAGYEHCLVLHENGTVTGWGSPSEAASIPDEIGSVVAIAAAGRHSAALLADGTVIEWGLTVNIRPKPQHLPFVVSITAENRFVLALLRDGAPSFTIQPRDVIVQPGKAAKFTAKAVSQETIDYQWQLDEKDIPGATRETLLVSSVQPGDSGDYSVKVSNRAGISVSRKAKLTVAGPLRLELLPVHDDSLHIQTTGPTGLTYTLQSSDDLNQWTDIATRTSSGGAVEFITPISYTNVSRLYRIRQGP